MIWVIFLIGVLCGLLISVFIARYGWGRGFLDDSFKALSVLFRSPTGVARAYRVFSEHRKRRRLQMAATAREVESLEEDIEDLQRQVRERKQKIREARWRAGKP